METVPHRNFSNEWKQLTCSGRNKVRPVNLGSKGEQIMTKSPPPDALSAEAAERFEHGSSERVLIPGWNRIFVLCGIAYICFHIAVLNFWSLDAWVFRAIHVNAAGVLCVILYAGRLGASRKRPGLWDLLLAGGAIFATVYIWSELDMLLMRTGVMMTTADVVVAIIGILVVLEITRRSSGLALPILASIFMLYCFAGPILPGVLSHRGYDLGSVASYLYSMDGVFGIATAAAAQYIVLFVVFAAFLQVSGAGAFFMNFAFGAMGWARGGTAKVALLSSALFGMISGSSVTNVVASGTFSIPVMKRAGYRASSAGAIEAAASTGGQLMPPIMGAGAFIMAEVTGIPYTSIIIAAIIPCLLYYLALYVHIDLEAQKEGIHGLPRSELPQLRPMLKDAFVLLPLVVLLALLFSGYSVIAAGTWGTASAMLVMFARSAGLDSRLLSLPMLLLLVMLIAGPSRVGPNVVGGYTMGLSAIILFGAYLLKAQRPSIAFVLSDMMQKAVEACSLATRQSLQLVAVCACAGIVVGVIGLTGLGGRFSGLLMGLAGESQLLALFFAMLIALILGMGMPTTAAYAIAASVVAPSLQRMGLPPLSVHFFIFYFAVVSAITPPIALSSFAGAALAGASPWETAFRSLRYGIAAFVVPYLFITHPAILMDGSVTDIIQTVATAGLGVWLLATASEGWLRGRLTPWFRVCLAVGALCLIAGDVLTDLVGVSVALALIMLRLRTRFGKYPMPE
tara:strand:- start:2614 stop:4827 length:2214 start_codon:yes stop_codon:yes gene_type:complete